MRFGLVFEGTRTPAFGGGFLKDLEVTKAEGCEKDGKQFVILSVSKPRKASDVVKAVKAYNSDTQDKMMLVPFLNGPEVVVFDRGNCYRAHPISKIIQEAVAAEDSWTWAVVAEGDAGTSKKMCDVGGKKKKSDEVGKPDAGEKPAAIPVVEEVEETKKEETETKKSAGGSKKKRAVNELESDLVEASIRPQSIKRQAIRLVTNAEVRERAIRGERAQCADGFSQAEMHAARKKKGMKRPMLMFDKHSISKDVVGMLLKEISRSMEETIQTKNQMIELLMNRAPQCMQSQSVGGSE